MDSTLLLRILSQIMLTTYVSPVIQVHLSVVGGNTGDILSSLLYMRAPYEIAVEDVNRIYNGTLAFSLRFETEIEATDCQKLLDNAERVAAQAYYRYIKREISNTSLFVLSAPGK